MKRNLLNYLSMSLLLGFCISCNNVADNKSTPTQEVDSISTKYEQEVLKTDKIINTDVSDTSKMEKYLKETNLESKSQLQNESNKEVVCCKYKRGSIFEFAKLTRKDCLETFFGEVVNDSNCK